MSYEDPEKTKAYGKAYYLAHEEKAKAYNKAYYLVHKEKIKKRSKDWGAANKEKKAATGKAYREANVEKTREQSRKYNSSEKGQKTRKARDGANKVKIVEGRKAHYEANKEKENSQHKVWAKANRGICAGHENKRRAIKIKAILPTTDLDLVEKIYEQRLIMAEENGEEYHVDHIIPLSKGGAHHQDNLRIITAKENMEKGNKYIPELGGVWADNDLAREHKKKHGIE